MTKLKKKSVSEDCFYLANSADINGVSSGSSLS